MTRPTYRRLAAFLALVLCPVLVLASSKAASAADYYGTKDTWTWKDDGDKLNSVVSVGTSIACNVSGYSVGNGTSLGAKGSIACKLGWNAPSGDTATNMAMTFSGNAVANNQFCEYTGSLSVSPDALDAGVKWSAFGTAVAQCTVTQACMQWTALEVNRFSPDTRVAYEACADVTLTPPVYAAAQPTGCTNGDPTSVEVTYSTGSGAWAGYHQHRHKITWAESPTPNKGNSIWTANAVRILNPGPGTSGALQHVQQTGTGGSYAMIWQGNVLAHDLNPSANWPFVADDHTGGQHGGTLGEVTGVQLNGMGGQGVNYGLTDPATCQFWFGPKILDRPNDTKDEPAGALNAAPVTVTPEPTDAPEPVAENSGCEFRALDPSTWATGSLCALVELVRDLIDVVGDVVSAVLGLAAQIASAIEELLRTLFIPETDEWGFAELFDTLKTRPPFSVAFDLGAAAGSMASGFSGGTCGTLLDMGGDIKVTCANVRAVPGFGALYAVAQVALWVMTSLGCWKLVSNMFQDGQ